MYMYMYVYTYIYIYTYTCIILHELHRVRVRLRKRRFAPRVCRTRPKRCSGFGRQDATKARRAISYPPTLRRSGYSAPSTGRLRSASNQSCAHMQCAQEPLYESCGGLTRKRGAPQGCGPLVPPEPTMATHTVGPQPGASHIVICICIWVHISACYVVFVARFEGHGDREMFLCP